MNSQKSKPSLPTTLQQLCDETLAMVRAHPSHEMGQSQRLRIYEALWSTSTGEKASRWLAILSARRVQPIYRQSIATSRYANDDKVVGLLDRMLEIAEKIVRGELAIEDVRRGIEAGDIEDFYHEILVAFYGFPRYVWLATLAAYHALWEALGARPLQTKVSRIVDDENGNMIITGSDALTDVELSGSGCHADDAPVDAAYAFAKLARQSYDVGKVLEFWEWWLTEAIPQAWKKALDT